MEITRRDFLKASSAVAAAVGLHPAGLMNFQKAAGAQGALPVIWLQGQTCSGCSVSLLNTVYYMTIDDLLLKTIDLEYHPTVMAAAGPAAVQAATSAKAKGGYVLVVEGAVPTGGGGKFCTVWPGMTMLNAVQTFASNTPYVIAVGTCASYGGLPGAAPNPTAARSVQSILGSAKKVVNIPGCPAHPDWIVGSIAYMIRYGKVPALDANGRPTDYFGTATHANCPNLGYYAAGQYARTLGGTGCLRLLGCRGPETFSDCPTRRWNSPAVNTAGVNWCIGAGAPCHGCTDPTFPDGMSPFNRMMTTPFGVPPALNHNSGQSCSTCHSTGGTGGTGTGGTGTGGTGTGGGVNCAQCHSDGRTGTPPGTLPAGHPAIGTGTGGTGTGGTGTGGTGTGGTGTGGTTTQQPCSNCHSDGRSGALPPGHPNITITTGSAGTGTGTGGGTTSGGDDRGGRDD